jgi:hypothetical protein
MYICIYVCRSCRSSAVRRWLSTAAARVRVRQHVGFVVDKAALRQVFSEYFGFPCQSFHRFLHYHNHPGLTQKAIKWPQCRVDLDSTPLYANFFKVYMYIKEKLTCHKMYYIVTLYEDVYTRMFLTFLVLVAYCFPLYLFIVVI